MAYRRSLRQQLCVGLTIIGAALLLPSIAAAEADLKTPVTASVSKTPELDLMRARQAENSANWAEACDLYEQILGYDRNQPEVKKHFLFCMRQCLRQYRHRDPSFSHQLLSAHFKLSEAQAFYKETVGKVQDYYVDSEKVEISRLFQEGLEELAMDLADAEFCQKYVTKPEDVPAFRRLLRARWGEVKVASLEEANQQIRAVAKEAHKRLGLNHKVVVVEFACGACNALDEYTFYLTQGDMHSGPDVKRPVVRMEDEGIGYIKLFGFQDTSTVAELEEALENLKRNGMRVLLLDLRGNSGGSLDVALQVIEHFLPAPQPIASTSGKLNKSFRSYATNVLEMPIFLLIDGETASAAELMAGALKVHQRAELVGQTTFGKSWVQKMVPVSQAPYGALRITWAQFYLYKTHDLSKQGGIVPTIPVEQATVPAGSMDDPQLQEALKRARSLLMASMMN